MFCAREADWLFSTIRLHLCTLQLDPDSKLGICSARGLGRGRAWPAIFSALFYTALWNSQKMTEHCSSW